MNENKTTQIKSNVSKYVKKEEEKKHWLEIAKELFENTIGYKEKRKNNE